MCDRRPKGDRHLAGTDLSSSGGASVPQISFSTAQHRQHVPWRSRIWVRRTPTRSLRSVTDCACLVDFVSNPPTAHWSHAELVST